VSRVELPDPFLPASNPPHTIVIIPARYAATRLPGKALADIGGMPMIEHVYRRAAAVEEVDAVVVATDDSRIAAAVERFGGIVRMTEGVHESGTDRVAEIARGLASDIVVNVQGDEPLIEPEMIAAVIRPLMADGTVSMSTLRRPLDDETAERDPNVVKVVVDRAGDALYFSRAPIPFTKGRGRDRPCFAHVGVYGYRREFLLLLASLDPTPLERAESLEQLRALEHGFRIRTIETPGETISVDTPEDLARVRALVASRRDSASPLTPRSYVTGRAHEPTT
jgi:3-deoxy-manno-octulosonate cytidylyltransferase (CMP-KDO synthetase)